MRALRLFLSHGSPGEWLFPSALQCTNPSRFRAAQGRGVTLQSGLGAAERALAQPPTPPGVAGLWDRRAEDFQ